MSAAALLHEVHAEGVKLALTEHGTIEIRGQARAVAKWTPAVRQNKPQLIDLLRLWRELEAAIRACCDARHDSAENREALLDDAWQSPEDWSWHVWYFTQETAKWTH